MPVSAAALAATIVTLVGLAVPLVGASAQATPARPDIDPSEWCGNQAPPCVVSASRNGVAITESDPTYAVSAAGSLQSDGEFLTQWGIADALVPGSFETLAPGDAGVPSQLTGNPLTFSEELGNSHKLNGQVFEGFWYGVLPNAFLVDMGINDPSTLTSAGISASVGTGTVTVTPGPTSTKIAITGITFSPRMVHIKRGNITPYAPTSLRTRRASATGRTANHRNQVSAAHPAAPITIPNERGILRVRTENRSPARERRRRGPGPAARRRRRAGHDLSKSP